MASGTSNPAFEDDTNQTSSENNSHQITVIHTNPESVTQQGDNNLKAEIKHLHESKSVPVIAGNNTYGSTVQLTDNDKAESLDDLNPPPMIHIAPSTTFTNNGDYGSRIILVEDKLANIPVDDAPPYKEGFDEMPRDGGVYAVTNYAANITLSPGNDLSQKKEIEDELDETSTGRDTWGKEIEFLLSCIAMSVGLGNVWRFPFIALANGGGAFVIPYIIVLVVIGKPIYYLEMLIGQFSSRGSAKVYDLCPALRGNFGFSFSFV